MTEAGDKFKAWLEQQEIAGNWLAPAAMGESYEVSYQMAFLAGFLAGQQSVWVDIKERLPVKSDYYVIIVFNCGGGWQTLIKSFFNVEKQDWSCRWPSSVTHWLDVALPTHTKGE